MREATGLKVQKCAGKSPLANMGMRVGCCTIWSDACMLHRLDLKVHEWMTLMQYACSNLISDILCPTDVPRRPPGLPYPLCGNVHSVDHTREGSYGKRTIPNCITAQLFYVGHISGMATHRATSN